MGDAKRVLPAGGSGESRQCRGGEVVRYEVYERCGGSHYVEARQFCLDDKFFCFTGTAAGEHDFVAAVAADTVARIVVSPKG